MRVVHVWLIASVRAMAMDRQDSNNIIVDIDFLGEGDEEKLTGRIYRFRRGVTRYPTPGTEVYPVSSADMQQIYSRSEEHTSELQSLMRISYAVFCLKKKYTTQLASYTLIVI